MGSLAFTQDTTQRNISQCFRDGKTKEGCSPASDDAVEAGGRRAQDGDRRKQAAGEETKLEAGCGGVGERMRREQENAGATSALLAGRGDGTDKEGRRRSCHPLALPLPLPRRRLRFPLAPCPSPSAAAASPSRSLVCLAPSPSPAASASDSPSRLRLPPRVVAVAVAKRSSLCLRHRHRRASSLCPSSPSPTVEEMAMATEPTTVAARWGGGGGTDAMELLAACCSSLLPQVVVVFVYPPCCWNSGSYGGSTQMLIEMVLDLGAVVLNCRESDHEFVVTVNIFLALRGLLWFLSHGNVFLVMVFVKKKNLLTSMQANKTSGVWHMTYLWQLNIDAAPLQMVETSFSVDYLQMMEELMSEIKVMDMVWNCKFFGTPLLIMDITILRTAQVIDQDFGFCSPAWLGFRIGCLPGNLIFTCFSRGAFVDPRKHREHQYGQAARHCRAPDSSISKARS
uniref:Uncharacterized protein n=1 Tax=Oryza nivara TaxID=4536 RepID=A0A0E0IJ93_ORYNI